MRDFHHTKTTYSHLPKTAIATAFFTKGDAYIVINSILLPVQEASVTIPDGSMELRTAQSDWIVIREMFEESQKGSIGSFYKFDTVLIGSKFYASVYGCWIDSFNHDENIASLTYDHLTLGGETTAEHQELVFRQRGKILGGNLGIL